MRRLLPLVLILLVAGCARLGDDASAHPAQPSGAWTVGAIEGDAVLAAAPPTLIFQAQRVGGTTGCNHYSAPAVMAGVRLHISEAVSTKKACTPALMAQERRFLAALEAVREHRRDGATLLLLDGEGRIRLTLSPGAL